MDRFKQYLELNYESEGTRNQYWACAHRYIALGCGLDQQSIDYFLQRYNNNQLNRSFVKAFLNCYGAKGLDIPRQRSRQRLPWSSTIFSEPAAAWRPSMFWVMRTRPGLILSKAARARWAGLG